MTPVTRGKIKRNAEQRVRGEDLPWPILEAVGLTYDHVRRHVRGEETDIDVMAGFEETIGHLERMKGRIMAVMESLRNQEPPLHQPIVDTADTTDTTDTTIAKRKADQVTSGETTRPAKKFKGTEVVGAAPQADGAKSPSPAAVTVAGPAVPYPQGMDVDSQPPNSSSSALPIAPSDMPLIANVAGDPKLSPTPRPSKPRTPLPTSRPSSSGSSASSASSPEVQIALNTGGLDFSAAQTQLASQVGSALALVSVPTTVSTPVAVHAPAPTATPISAPASTAPLASTAAPAPAPPPASTPAVPFIFKTGPLPPHILNAPIPAPPPIPTGPDVSAKTIAAYRKCHEIHFSGSGGRRALIPCFPCQKSPDKIHSCIINMSVGGGLICNHCAQSKEKCSEQLNYEARIIRETGVDLGPNKCQQCVLEEQEQHDAGNLTFRAECYQAPVGFRKKRQLGSACSRCIFKGKKESCSVNTDPRLRNHRPRDMIEN